MQTGGTDWNFSKTIALLAMLQSLHSIGQGLT
jgi:hypothetical protein